MSYLWKSAKQNIYENPPKLSNFQDICIYVEENFGSALTRYLARYIDIRATYATDSEERARDQSIWFLTLLFRHRNEVTTYLRMRLIERWILGRLRRMRLIEMWILGRPRMGDDSDEKLLLQLAHALQATEDPWTSIVNKKLTGSKTLYKLVETPATDVLIVSDTAKEEAQVGKFCWARLVEKRLVGIPVKDAVHQVAAEVRDEEDWEDKAFLATIPDTADFLTTPSAFERMSVTSKWFLSRISIAVIDMYSSNFWFRGISTFMWVLFFRGIALLLGIGYEAILFCLAFSLIFRFIAWCVYQIPILGTILEWICSAAVYGSDLIGINHKWLNLQVQRLGVWIDGFLGWATINKIWSYSSITVLPSNIYSFLTSFTVLHYFTNKITHEVGLPMIPFEDFISSASNTTIYIAKTALGILPLSDMLKTSSLSLGRASIAAYTCKYTDAEELQAALENLEKSTKSLEQIVTQFDLKATQLIRQYNSNLPFILRHIENLLLQVEEFYPVDDVIFLLAIVVLLCYLMVVFKRRPNRQRRSFNFSPLVLLAQQLFCISNSCHPSLAFTCSSVSSLVSTFGYNTATAHENIIRQELGYVHWALEMLISDYVNDSDQIIEVITEGLKTIETVERDYKLLGKVIGNFQHHHGLEAIRIELRANAYFGLRWGAAEQKQIELYQWASNDIQLAHLRYWTSTAKSDFLSALEIINWIQAQVTMAREKVRDLDKLTSKGGKLDYQWTRSSTSPWLMASIPVLYLPLYNKIQEMKMSGEKVVKAEEAYIQGWEKERKNLDAKRERCKVAEDYTGCLIESMRSSLKSASGEPQGGSTAGEGETV